MIERVLQTTNARILLDNRWMYWDEDTDDWVILERPYGKHGNTTIYRGNSLDEALVALTNPQDDEP